MIIQLKSTVSASKAAELAAHIEAFHVVELGHQILITSSSVNELPAQAESMTETFWAFKDDMQLASRLYKKLYLLL